MSEEKQNAGLPVSPPITPEGSQGTGSREVQWWPGPWRLESDDEPENGPRIPGEEFAVHVCANDDDSPDWACILTCANTDSHTAVEWQRYRASACLAAAAPELYEALADVVKMFRAFPLLQRMNGAKVAEIEAVLAKARGEDAPAIQSPTPQQEPKKGTQGGQ